MSLSVILVNQLNIRDTTTHTYTTDPPNSTFTNNYIAARKLESQKPSITSYAVWIYNTTDQTLTVQPVANIGVYKSDGTTLQFPWFNVGSSYTVNALSQDWQIYQFAANPYEQISVDLSYSTAPSEGNVYSLLYLYQNRV